jgi:hypothetical protein
MRTMIHNMTVLQPKQCAYTYLVFVANKQRAESRIEKSTFLLHRLLQLHNSIITINSCNLYEKLRALIQTLRPLYICRT